MNSALFSVLFSVEKKIYLIFCASQLLAGKNVNFFALRCKQAHTSKTNTFCLKFIHQVKIFMLFLCVCLQYTFILRFAAYNIFYSFGLGKLLWYALAIAFSIPMLLH